MTTNNIIKELQKLFATVEEVNEALSDLTATVNNNGYKKSDITKIDNFTNRSGNTIYLVHFGPVAYQFKIKMEVYKQAETI